MEHSLQEITDSWSKWFIKDSADLLFERSSFPIDANSSNTATVLETAFGDNRGQAVDEMGHARWYDNSTGSPQSDHVEYSDVIDNTASWSVTVGLGLATPLNITVGVPLQAAAEVTLSAEIDLSLKQSWSESKSKTWQHAIPMVISPKKSVKCQRILNLQKLDYPFTTRVRLCGQIISTYRAPNIDTPVIVKRNIQHVFEEINKHNIITTAGYEIVEDGVIATVPAVLTGSLGVSFSVKNEEVWLRGWIPTQEDVQQELVRKLIVAAHKELKQQTPYNITESSSLTTCMRDLAKGRFKDDFGHTFDARYCPDDCHGIVHLVDQALILFNDDVAEDEISEFVSEKLLNAANLPEGMQDEYENDITEVIKSLLGGPTENQCHTTQFVKTYEAKERDQFAMKCASILVHENGTLTMGETNVKATIHALHFIGAFYAVSSPIDAAIGTLQKKAYCSAEDLTSDFDTTITQDDNLKQALARYGASQFKEKYNYEYTSTPANPSQSTGPRTARPSPQSYRGSAFSPNDTEGPSTPGTQSWITRNEHLGSFHGRSMFNLHGYVQNQIFGGLQIPDSDAGAAALVEVQSAFDSIFAAPQRGAWNSLFLGRTFPASNVGSPQVAMDAVIVHWTEETTVCALVEGNTKATKESVSLTYTYFMGVLREL